MQTHLYVTLYTHCLSCYIIHTLPVLLHYTHTACLVTLYTHTACLVTLHTHCLSCYITHTLPVLCLLILPSFNDIFNNMDSMVLTYFMSSAQSLLYATEYSQLLIYPYDMFQFTDVVAYYIIMSMYR
jgi:hypothetical protein